MLVAIVCGVLIFVALALAEAGAEVGLGFRPGKDHRKVRDFLRLLSCSVMTLIAFVARYL